MAILKRTKSAEIALREPARYTGLAIVETPSGHARFQPRIGRTVARFHQHRAAQGVEAINRAGIQYAQLADRRFGQQVEGDDIAERLIEPRPVQIDRDSLRLPLQGGRGKTAIDQIGLPGVALRILQRHASDCAGQGAQQIRRACPADVGGGQGQRIVGVDRPARRSHGDRLALVVVHHRLRPCLPGPQHGRPRQQRLHPSHIALPYFC